MRRPDGTIRVIAKARQIDWVVGILAGCLAIAGFITAAEFGDVHTAGTGQIYAWAGSAAVLVFGVVATRRLATVAGHIVTQQTIRSAGAAVRLLATGVGYLIVAFAVLGALKISIEHLLVGAGVAGIVLGIAAQQSLGNVFAGIVLLLARPFSVGEDIRIRSGALGGVFDGRVLDISLTYVTVRTGDGVFKIPNSGMFAAAVGIPIGPLPAAVVAPPSPPGDERSDEATDLSEPPG